MLDHDADGYRSMRRISRFDRCFPTGVAVEHTNLQCVGRAKERASIILISSRIHGGAMNPITRFLAALAVFLTALPLNAALLVREVQLVATMPIQGITFETSPRDAFERLRSLGFKAGNIETFDDWDTDGIEFVRGTYADPKGESRIIMSRKDGRITTISETWNRPRDHFNAFELVDEARRHFGIPEDEKECRAVSTTAGRCRVQDRDDPQDVDYVYGLQILPGMLIRYLESKKAYAP